MAADEPPYLTVGTDVSAKYKGAFCEAKIKKVNRFVKCKLTFKNLQGAAVLSDDQVRGTLRVGAHVEAKHPEKNQFMEAVINKLLDYSQYTVVFDDGDETTLRRTSLCLKSGRHFAESESLDQLPLTNPEHFGTPVIGSKSRRKRRSAALNISVDDDSSEDEASSKRLKESKQRDADLGKVVYMEFGEKRKKELWIPALVVAPTAQEGIKINSKEEYLVRSFKNGRYYQVLKKETRSFNKDMGSKFDNASVRAAMEKAQLYLEHNELPSHWDRDLLMGASVPSAEEDSHESDSDTSDDEPSEEKDRFVAQLYKFMDERGTPINKAPTVGNRDLNLYKLFKVVQKMGGYNRVTNQNQWKSVFTRMGLPNPTSSSLQQLRLAYKKYLHSFEDFFRKLGCTMVTNTRSNRVRHRSDRNLIMTRNRDRDLSASRARLQIRESKEKKKEKEEKVVKVECEKEEEKVRTPRTRTSYREPDRESSKDPEVRVKEEVKERVDSSEKKGTRQSFKQEAEVDEKKTLKDKRQESEDETNYNKSKEKTNNDKSKEKTGSDKAKERTSSDKAKEKTGSDKAKEKISSDKSKEKASSDKSKEKMSSDKAKEKSSSDNLKEKVNSEKSKEKTSTCSDKPKEKTNSDKSKETTPKQIEKIQKKVKEKKEKSVDLKKKEVKPKVASPKEDEEKTLPKPLQLDKVKKKRVERVKKEPIPEKEVIVEKKEEVNSDDEESKLESSESDKKTKDPSTSLRKQIRRKIKIKEEEMDDDESRDSDDEKSLRKMLAYDWLMKRNKDSDINEQACGGIEIGDKLKVKYGRGKQLKIYEAKVIKIEDSSLKPYFVHYTGWNVRYDEWIRRSRIVDNTTKSQAKKKKSALKAANVKLASKRSRSNSISPVLSTLPLRKSLTPTSQQISRHTRSDKSNLFTGLEPRKRIRRKSGMSSTDLETLQASDNESGETSDACDSFDKSIDKASESIQDLLDEPESLPKEDEVSVKIEKETEEECLIPQAVTSEPEIHVEIKAEVIEEAEATCSSKPIESVDDASLFPTLPNHEESVVNEQEILDSPASPVTSDIPALIPEESIPSVLNTELEVDEIPKVKDVESTSSIEEGFGSICHDTEHKDPLETDERLLHQIYKEDTESEEEALNDSFDNSESLVNKPTELAKSDTEIKNDVPILLNEKAVVEETSYFNDNIKESDICSFVSKLEESEQCEDAKANIEKLINDLESPSPETSDALHNDSESDGPACIDDFTIKEESQSALGPAIATDASLTSDEKLSFEVPDEIENQSDKCETLTSKKEGKKKKSKVPKSEKKIDFDEESKGEGKLKSKKRQKHSEDQEEEVKHRTKKLKKNRSKKKADSESSSEVEKKVFEGDKVKKKEKKRKDDRKPSGAEINKGGDGTKKEKRKGKKNKDKMSEKCDVLGEKKTKKKRKNHTESSVDVDSEKSVEIEKHGKPMKKKKGKKSKAKEDAHSKLVNIKKEKKLKLELPPPVVLPDEPQTEEDEPEKDLSFLLCEEKVPASPVGNISPNIDDSSNSKPTASSFVENEAGNFSGFTISCLVKTVEKHEEVAAVLDNTPPTTPESTDSALLGTPPHEDDSVCIHPMEFGNREMPSASYLHESHKGDMMESDDTEDSTFSSHSGSDNDRRDSAKSFFKRQNLDLEEMQKKQKKSRRSLSISEGSSSLRNKQRMAARDAKEMMKAADSSDSEGSQHMSNSLYASSLIGLGQLSNLSPIQSNRPSKFNFFVPLDDYTDADKRIAVIQEKLSELRKVYMGLKAEVALIDRRRKKAKKKEKESANSTLGNSSSQCIEVQSAS